MGGMTPQEYVQSALRCRGIQLRHQALRNLSARNESESIPGGVSPYFYDIPLLNVLGEGSRSEVEAAISSKEIANAQNRNGESLLMKAMRKIIHESGLNRTWLIEVLLERGADCMVCCDTQKNILHDMFWASKPPPTQVLHAMEFIADLLCKHLGRDRVVSLLLSPDRLGQTPVQYILPLHQTNWQVLIDIIVGYEEGSQTGGREDHATGKQKKQTVQKKKPQELR